MGLDATVRCRCWEDGLCAPTRLKSHIHIDAGSNSLDIDLPWETFKDEILEFDQWVIHACAHPEMMQASEWIANWAGVRALQNALRTAGENEFAGLLRELPNNNGGLTFPEAARSCLKELDRFESVGVFGNYAELVDIETGTLIAERIEAYDGWFQSNGSTGYEFSLEADGHLRVRHAQLGTVFRAKEFGQTKVSGKEFIYTDLTNGARCICPDGLQNHQTFDYPLMLKGVVGFDSASRYAYSIAALRRVFSAAIEVNHPVSWR